MNKKLNFKLAIGLFLPSLSLYAGDDPCRGKGMMLTLINRPSFSDSACTVPLKKLLLEGGFQNQQIIEGGTQINAPELSIRLGLSKNSEFVINPSNYIHQTIYPFSGTTPTWLGVKYRIYYNKNWVITGEGLFSPPSGNKAFGSRHVEGTINGIIFHEINENFSWQFQMGISELSDPQISGSHRYQSFNPDFVMSYTFKQKIDMYLEFFGQTKTSSTESFGLIGGIGLIYLFNSKTTFDISFYQRIKGELLGFEHFIGAGMTRLF